jgi:hypothetical protein
MTDVPNNGVAYGLKHVGEQLYHDSKRRGETNDHALMLMGGSMAFIGAKIAWDAFRRIMAKTRRRALMCGMEYHGGGRKNAY